MLSPALTVPRVLGDAISFALLAIAALGATRRQDPSDISHATAAVEGADTLFGFSVCGLGDLDGDGVDEFAVTAPNASQGDMVSGSVLVFSGLSLEVLRRFDGAALNANLGVFVQRPGDLDGDGREDLEVAPMWRESVGHRRRPALSPTRGVEISLEEQRRALKRRPPTCTPAIPDEVCLFKSCETHGAKLDWDNDGCPDLVRYQSGPPHQIEIVSGATGAPLFMFDLPDRSSVTHFACSALDLDGDHTLDLLMNVSGDEYGRLLAISGVDGSRLHYQFLEFASEGGTAYGLFAVGDLDCDGCDDFIVSRPGTFRTRLDAFSGRTFTPLWSWGRPPSDTRQCTFDVLSDRNGDGAPELLCSNLYWVVDGPDWDHVGTVVILSGKDGIPITILDERDVYTKLAASYRSTPSSGDSATPREKR